MKRVSLILFVLLVLSSCQTRDKDLRPQVLPVGTGGELPRAQANKNEVLLDQVYFQISYNQEHRLPNWVYYRLTSKNLKTKAAKRRDKFFSDPQLQQKGLVYAKPTDYEGKVFDRGHMAPSEDFVWSQVANDATFVMTNMAPQSRSLNRGSWKKLETKVRKWACTEGELRVVSGPLLEVGLERMPSQVSVPKRFFKVILDETPPRKAVGFIYSQDDGSKDYKSAAHSLKEVEKLAGYFFFADLNPSERSKIESAYDLNAWVETDCMGKLH